MEYVYAIVGIAISWAIWRASQPPTIFRVRLSNGTPTAITGTVTAGFLARVREVAADAAITHSEIRGIAHKHQIRLQFSREFPETARQQIRNWWQLHGWPAPPR
jgi:hypothetical protein